MRATNLTHCHSRPAPDEWKEIPAIKKAMKDIPKNRYGELSLQPSVKVAVWMGYSHGVWLPVSDIFYIHQKL